MQLSSSIIRILTAGCLAVSVVAPSPAHAQDTTRTLFAALSVGASQPLGDFAEGVGTGLSVGVAGLLKLRGTPRLSIRADIAYAGFNHDATDLAAQSGVRFQTIVLSGSVSGIFHLGSASGRSVRPYLVGGLGVSNVKTVTIANSERMESPGEFAPGINAGAGIEWRLFRVETFMEARLEAIFTNNEGRSGTQYLPIVVGVRF